MKRVLLAAIALSLVAGAIALSGAQKPMRPDLQVDLEARNPWTHLRLNNDPETFHFVVVSDRTGGHRARVFSQAVEQINLLQPAFVVSVGDLIEGYTKDRARLAEQWKEFQTYTSKLQMPFFYVPGNHDVANGVESKEWADRFGRRYYHFLYRDVLFLAVCSDDPAEDEAKGKISPQQVEYFQKVLKENPSVRWTIVCVHKPMWTHADLDKNGWLEIEKALDGRKYTVFAGHIHHYQKFVRNGMNYYQLATTGGGSKMRGLKYGEFDHFAWVTMTRDRPVIANLLLDGIYPENLKPPITAEEGVVVYNRKPVQPVAGTVLLDGVPVPGALVTFYLVDPADRTKATRSGDGYAEADGTFRMTTYTAFDGVPAGSYKVTVVRREPFFEPSGKLGKNRLPARYASPQTTDLTATVKTGPNELMFNLSP